MAAASPVRVILSINSEWPVRATSRFRGSEQPKPGRLGDGGRPRRHIELRQRIRDVPMHGVLADGQPFGDRLIAQAARDQPEHFHFARRQAARVARSRDRPRPIEGTPSVDRASPRRRRSRGGRRGVSGLRVRGGLPPRRRRCDSVVPSRARGRCACGPFRTALRSARTGPRHLRSRRRATSWSPAASAIQPTTGLPRRAAQACAPRSAMLRSSSSATARAIEVLFSPRARRRRGSTVPARRRAPCGSSQGVV